MLKVMFIPCLTSILRILVAAAWAISIHSPWACQLLDNHFHPLLLFFNPIQPLSLLFFLLLCTYFLSGKVHYRLIMLSWDKSGAASVLVTWIITGDLALDIRISIQSDIFNNSALNPRTSIAANP